MKKVLKKNSKKNGGLEPGLYVVAIPIGNLDDVSIHAKEILTLADVIGAEDTRVTKVFLKKLEIAEKRIISYHNHNEAESAKGIIDLIQQGNAVAIVTDAGTPAISDPGTRVVRDAHKAGIKVTPVPGASSLTSALSVSGLSGGSIYFGEFLPEKQPARLELLQKVQSHAQVLVFFEAPHRLKATLDDVLTVFGETHEMCVCREMTKSFETVLLSTVSEVRSHFQVNEPRGEIVLVIKGKSESKLGKDQTKQRITDLLAGGASSSDILENLQPVSELPRKELYNLILHLKKV